MNLTALVIRRPVMTALVMSNVFASHVTASATAIARFRRSLFIVAVAGFMFVRKFQGRFEESFFSGVQRGLGVLARDHLFGFFEKGIALFFAGFGKGWNSGATSDVL